MSSKSRRKRAGRGALFMIGLLFLASGAIRLLDGTGVAIAKEMESFGLPESKVTEGQADFADSCDPEPEIRAALKSLRDRAVELDRRDQKIQARSVALELAESEIRTNMAALIEAEESLKATIALADGAAESDIGKLIEVYQNMKPKDAAALFEEMDPSFSAGFLARMRPDTAAAIMAGLTPTKAYTVSVVLAGRNTGVPIE